LPNNLRIVREIGPLAKFRTPIARFTGDGAHEYKPDPGGG